MRICPGTSRRRDPPVSELYSAMVCIFYEACLLIAILMLGACGGGPEKIPLHFSYITTKTGSFVAAGALPVVDLALEQINNRTDILPNYTLSYTTILDSKVGVYILRALSTQAILNCIVQPHGLFRCFSGAFQMGSKTYLCLTPLLWVLHC